MRGESIAPVPLRTAVRMWLRFWPAFASRRLPGGRKAALGAVFSPLQTSASKGSQSEGNLEDGERSKDLCRGT